MNKKPFLFFAIFISTVTTAWAQSAKLPSINLDQTDIDRTNKERTNSYVDVLEKASPSVVSVYTGKKIGVIVGGSRSLSEELLRRYYGQPSQPRQIIEKEVPAGMGSGVIISSDGYVLTNNHVVSDQYGRLVDIITIKLPDGTEYEGKIVGNDPQTDLAVIKVEAKDLPAITIADSANVKVGDVVFAIGNPLGIGQTVTMGIVSALNRSQLGLLGQNSYEDFIQVDAAINKGNSGGALIDSYGRLIGINTAILSESGGNMGIGFAIPTNIARTVMTSLISYGKAYRIALSITVQNVSKDTAEAFGLKAPTGALIVDVTPNSEAEKAGFKRGDIITSLNKKEIPSPNALRVRLAEIPMDSTAIFEVLRNGKKEVVSVAFKSPQIASEKQEENIEVASKEIPKAITTVLEGITFTTIENARKQINIPADQKGIVVASVSTDSPYAATLRPGMIIIESNNRPVNTEEEFRLSLKKGINRLWVREGDSVVFVPLRY